MSSNPTLSHVSAAVMQDPWLIQPLWLDVIAEIVDSHMAGKAPPTVDRKKSDAAWCQAGIDFIPVYGPIAPKMGLLDNSRADAPLRSCGTRSPPRSKTKTAVACVFFLIRQAATARAGLNSRTKSPSHASKRPSQSSRTLKAIARRWPICLPRSVIESA